MGLFCVRVAYEMYWLCPLGIVAATMLIETAPGVNVPVLSSGSPCGSEMERVAVMVPSAAIWAPVILNTSPGRTNCTREAFAKNAFSCVEYGLGDSPKRATVIPAAKPSVRHRWRNKFV